MKNHSNRAVRFFSVFGIAAAVLVAMLLAATTSAHYGSVSTDKAQYAPEDTVIVSGTGFGAGELLAVPVIRPDGSIVHGDGLFTPGWDTVTANASGSFTYNYQLDGIYGVYTVKVFHSPWGGPGSGDTLLASTTFIDADKIDFTQCQNDSSAPTDVRDDCKWGTGAINTSNSVYAEGDAVPQRILRNLQTAGSKTLSIEYEFSKANKYAYDFLTTTDLTQCRVPAGPSGSACSSGPSLLNECGDLPSFVSATECSNIVTDATSRDGSNPVGVPSDPFDLVSLQETAGRQFWVGCEPAASCTAVVTVSFPDLNSGGGDAVSPAEAHDPDTDPDCTSTNTCSDSSVHIDVTFTTSTADTIVGIWFAGHLSRGGLAGGWGAGFGASDVSGGPYHIKHEGRDNGIQVGGVPQAFFTVNKDFSDNSSASVTVSLSCTSGTDTPATATATEVPSSPAVFSITGASGDPTCTATESPIPAGYTSTGTCSALLSVGTCTIFNSFNNADVKKQSLTVLSANCLSPPPASINVSQTVTLCLRGVLHNNGGFTPVGVLDTSTATPPGGCTAVVTTAPTSHTLATSVSITVDHLVNIHCSGPSFHTFQFQNCLTITTAGVTDLVPGNNCKTASITVASIAQADLKKVSITAAGPSEIDVSENAAVVVTSVVHNNGPFGPVSASDVTTATAPADCTVTPPSVSQQLSLPVSDPSTTVGATFTIHCLEPSDHTFQFCNDIQPKDLHVADPDPANNTKCTAHTVAVIGEADLKQPVVTFPPGGTGTYPVSEDIPITATAEFHNNGPFEVSAQDIITISFPADCTITVLDPLGNPVFGPIPGPGPLTFPAPIGVLPVSATVAVDFDFLVHCFQPSFHTFVATGCLQIDPIATLHVVDPDPSNNCFTTTQTYALVAQADLKKVSITAAGPSEIDVSENAAVVVTSVVHNNGPFGPVGASDVTTATAPADCTVTPPSVSQQLSLPVSDPSTTVGATFTIHCLTPSDHTFQFCNEIQPKDLHVEDPITTNNTKCTAHTVAVISQSDVKLQNVSIPLPNGPSPVSEDVPFSLGGALHNNGPAAATAQVSVSINMPADCTLTLLDQFGNPVLVVPGPGPLQFQGPPQPLAVSETVVIGANFTVHCFGPSFHVFSGQGCVSIVGSSTNPHIIDPEPINNCFSTSATFAFEAEADLKKLDMTFITPDVVHKVSETYPVHVDALIHNNGPASTDFTDSLTVSPPPDCTAAPPAQATGGTAPASADTTMGFDFTVHCTEPSSHTFIVCDVLATDQVHVVDPDLGNNGLCEPITLVFTADADVKKMSWGVGVPSAATVSEDVIAGWGMILHNNGPFGPVGVHDVLAATAVPPDCTVTPPAIPIDLSLSVSAGIAIDGFFTIHCTAPSFHTFEFCDTLTVDQEHVTDPDPSNNGSCITYTMAMAVSAVADVKATPAAVSCPPSANVSTPFTCTVSTTIHNNGPFGPVNVDTTLGLSGPGDCTLTPAGSQTQQDTLLVVSSPVTVTKSWSVSCTSRSDHTFSGSSSVVIDQLHITDPAPGNNGGTGTDTVPVFALADVKVPLVTVSCPSSGQVITPFTCTVNAVLHNNGPFSPVNVDVTLTLTVPFDCTKTPSGSQVQQDVSLPISVDVTVSKSWSVTCTNYSFHLFSGSATAAVDQVHVMDPTSSNNTGSGQTTTPVLAPTDVKVTGISVTAPPSASPNVPFTVTINLTIHNNGPVSPVDVEGGIGLSAPDDCELTPHVLIPVVLQAGWQLFNPITLTASVANTQTRSFTVECTLSGTHELIACGRLGPLTEHVFDPQILNNTGRSEFTVDVGNSPYIDVTTACTVPGDPPETCGNGIDEDQDGLIDEEPDPDGDGLSNCVDTDDDNDGYSDVVEAYVGTDPVNDCPKHSGDSAWPPDFNNSQSVNISDVLSLKPVFGTSPGNGPYLARTDLNASGSINITDVLSLKPKFGGTCS